MIAFFLIYIEFSDRLPFILIIFKFEILFYCGIY